MCPSHQWKSWGTRLEGSPTDTTPIEPRWHSKRSSASSSRLHSKRSHADLKDSVRAAAENSLKRTLDRRLTNQGRALSVRPYARTNVHSKPPLQPGVIRLTTLLTIPDFGRWISSLRRRAIPPSLRLMHLQRFSGLRNSHRSSAGKNTNFAGQPFVCRTA